MPDFEPVANRSSELYSETCIRVYTKKRSTHLIDKQLRLDSECDFCNNFNYKYHYSHILIILININYSEP